MEIEKQKYTAKTFTKRYYESIIQQMEGKVDILDSREEMSRLFNQLDKVETQPLQKALEEKQVTHFSSIRTYDQLLSETGNLVQIDCMVQDTSDPEFYACYYIDHPKLKKALQDRSVADYDKYLKICQLQDYVNNEDIQAASLTPQIFDRSVCYGVQVPCQAQEILASNLNKPPEAGEKDTGSRINSKKLSIDRKADISLIAPELCQAKIFNQSPNYAVSQFPCVLYFYSNQENLLPKINDRIRCVGILSYSPEVFEESQEDDYSASYTRQYPTWFVPRIHVISFQSQANDFAQLCSSIQLPSSPDLLLLAKDNILSLLKAICLNDELIPQLMLCSLVSSVFAEQDAVKVGKLVLNVYRVPFRCALFTLWNPLKKNLEQRQFINLLKSVLQTLCVNSLELLLSLKYLTTERFSPEKNYQTNQFEYGLFQMPKTQKHYLIIDETQLEAGTLNQDGLKNILILNQMLEHQTLLVSSQYFQLQFPVDVSGIILSEGKSFLYHDIKVPFSVQEPKIADGQKQEQSQQGNITVDLSSTVAADLLIKQDQKLISLWQSYIIRCKQLALELKMEPSLSKRVTDEYVEERKKTQNQPNPLIDAECLRRRLLLARLLAACNLQDQIRQENYELAKKMDDEITKRNGQGKD